jgi:tetratricopeptide (TPR) repeat protein
MEQDDYKAARDFAIRGLASNPESVPLVLARARAENALGNGQMAAELAHVAMVKSPENAESREVLVAVALKGGDAELLKEARSLTETALEKSPTDEQLQLANASILAAQNQIQKAEADLKAYSGTAQGSRSGQTFLALAEFRRVRGDVEGCKANIQKAEQLSPKDSGIVQAKLLLLATQKRFDEIPNVVAAYRAAGFEDPKILLSAAAILVTSESPDHRKAAVKLYEDVLAAKPKMTGARLGLAAAAYRAGDAQRAKKVYGDVLKEDSGNARAMNDLAWILAENDHDYKAALELADKCLKIDPANTHLLDTRGFILSNLAGRLDEARKTFEELVDATSPGGQARAQALLQLARVCSKLKDQAATKKCLEEARQIDDVKQVFDPRERAEIARLTGNL